MSPALRVLGDIPLALPPPPLRIARMTFGAQRRRTRGSAGHDLKRFGGLQIAKNMNSVRCIRAKSFPGACYVQIWLWYTLRLYSVRFLCPDSPITCLAGIFSAWVVGRIKTKCRESFFFDFRLQLWIVPLSRRQVFWSNF